MSANHGTLSCPATAALEHLKAQLGARLAQRVRPEWLRLLLAVMVLLVAARMALGLGWRPDEIYTVTLS